MSNLNAQEFPYSYKQENLMVHFTMTAAVSTDLATHPPEEEKGETHILLFLNLILGLLCLLLRKGACGGRREGLWGSGACSHI